MIERVSDLANRLSELCRPAAGIDPAPLDRVLATIAELAPDPPAVDDMLGALDALAGLVVQRTTESRSAEHLLAEVFGSLGFAGDRTGYHRPESSYLHRVLERRRGIPLSLAVVTVEIGRRVGVQLDVVGMPGHVLVCERPSTERWFDPFDGGRELALDDCRALFGRFHPVDRFERSLLDPIDARQVASRALANLKVAHRNTGDRSGLIEVATVAAALPWAPDGEHLDLAKILVEAGRTEPAADILEALIQRAPARAKDLRAAVTRLRAHRN